MTMFNSPTNPGAPRQLARSLAAALRCLPTRSESGDSLVEMALLLPILTMLLLGTVDLGRLAYMSIEVSNAARAGVQYGQQNPTTWADVTGMQTAATNDATDLAGANNGNLTAVATYWCQCSDGSGVVASCSPSATSCAGTHHVNYVKVVTTATYKPWFSCPGIPSSTTLTAQAVMRAGQ
ncbi:MAG TPA: TadE/TadG family type IV pilus assembly protein [Candidatus Acidoferrales bacterium]|nr:TadE/TadG family type IV pilus assembly protein [Candidatus Acidoferrales bacterium]